VPHSKRPSQEDKDLLVTKARNITDVVVACRETGLEWFEQLLDTLFKPKEDKDDATKKNTEASPMLVLACQQIVDCLVESVLRMEESTSEEPSADPSSDPMAAVTGKPAGSISASKRLVACLTTLYLFAKIRPQLLVEHVQVTINSIKFQLSQKFS
jgi:cohesin loading factor subunit SCC2